MDSRQQLNFRKKNSQEFFSLVFFFFLSFLCKIPKNHLIKIDSKFLCRSELILQNEIQKSAQGSITVCGKS